MWSKLWKREFNGQVESNKMIDQSIIINMYQSLELIDAICLIEQLEKSKVTRMTDHQWNNYLRSVMVPEFRMLPVLDKFTSFCIELLAISMIEVFAMLPFIFSATRLALTFFWCMVRCASTESWIFDPKSKEFTELSFWIITSTGNSESAMLMSSQAIGGWFNVQFSASFQFVELNWNFHKFIKMLFKNNIELYNIWELT